MKAQSQTWNLQAQFGIRWIVAALLILSAMGSAHAADKISRNASLHITVTVMPTVQAQAMAQAKESRSASAVTYQLQPVVAKQTREIRSMSTDSQSQTASAAVLETLTTLAD